MSRKIVVTILLVVCAAALTASVALGFGGIFGEIGYKYDNAKEYTAGDAEITGTVKNLDIDWTSGKIIVEYHKEDTIELHETSKKEISDDMKMRWWLDGETLRVKYAKSGFFMNFKNISKQLTVTLPEDIVLDDFVIDATSGDIQIPSLKTENMVLDVTSGNINAAVDAGKITIETTSGDIDLKTVEKCDEVLIDTTSGKTNVTGEKIGNLKVDTTSGGGNFEIRESDNVSIESTSGNITVKLGTLGTLKIDATSGDVKAFLPEEPGFTARLDTTSGKVNCVMPISVDGKSYVCGDGSGTVDIDITSGNIQLDRAEFK